MNRLDKVALNIAERHIEHKCCNEEGFIELITCAPVLNVRKVPYIQQQAFAERAHYFWLCLTRGIEPCS